MGKDENKQYDPPVPGRDDVAYTIARAGISSIPVAGAAAAEFFTALFAAPVERRRQRWMEEVAKGLQDGT